MASEYVPVALERHVFERARGRCEYCQLPEAFSSGAFEIEHIHPRSLGGLTNSANLALSCSGCNSFKGSKVSGADPQTGQTVSLFHPRQHVWSEHFRWSDDSLQVEGISAIGRATVELLRLNRRGLMNLRRLLIDDEKHPPP
jgi:hypothetical protein